MSEPARPSIPRPARWLRTAADKLPTKWFLGIATGVFLAATAAFGGLNEVSPPAPPQLEAGTAHVNDHLSITVTRAVLIDALPGSGTFPAPGERVLVVVTECEDVAPFPLEPDRVINAVRRTDALDVKAALARGDDATLSPWLQPKIPAQLMFTWAVPANAYAAGDTLELTLFDEKRTTGSFVTAGDYWVSNPPVGATLTVTIDDVGAGKKAESG